MTGIQLDDYDLRLEVRRDNSGKIVAGLLLGDILRQNQSLILTMKAGELKEAPAIGCGISDMLLEYDPLSWRHQIREQLEMDGQKVSSVKITHQGIEIDATYRET